MADTLKLTNLSGDFLALTQDSALFNDIGTLGAHWSQLAAAISKASADPVTNGPALVQWLLANLNAPATAAIFTAAGAQGLLQNLIAAQAKIAAILPNGTALLSPLSAFAAPTTPPSGVPGDWVNDKAPGVVKIAPGTFTTAPAVAPDLTVSLALTGDIGVEADAEWPYASDAMGAGYLLVAAEGNFSANGTFRLPFSYSSLGVTGGAGLAPEILFYFQEPDRTKIFGAAVGAALAVLPDPFDPASVWQAFAHNNLAGMILTCDGHATANVDLSIGETASWPGVLSGSASIKVSVGLTRKAAFELSLRRTGSAVLGTMAVIARLTRNISAENDWGLGLGIDIDPGPILAKVQSVLNDALTDVDAVIAQITPFLTPGTWLEKNAVSQLDKAISGWVGDPTVAVALTQDVALLTGTAAGDTGGLTTAITKAVTAAIDNVGATAATNAASAVTSVTSALTATFPALGTTAFQRTLTADVTNLVGAYETALQNFAGTLLNDTGFPAIEASLAKVGAKVSTAVADANNVLSGLRDFITKYTTRVQHILTVAVAAAKSKISIRLSYESANTSGTDYELSGRFAAMTGAAGDIYRALAFGQLAGIQQAFANKVPGFALDTAKSAVMRLSGMTSTLGYDVVLLGLELSGQEVLTSTAQAVVDAQGNVTISGQASDTATQTTASATRSLSFSTTYDFKAAAKDIAGGRAIIKLGLSAALAENNLKRADVSAFLARLEQFGLLATIRTAKANSVFDSWASTRGANTPFGGSAAITLNFDAAGMQALVTRGQAIGNAATSSAEGHAQFRRAINAMIETGEMSTQNMHGTIGLFDSTGDLGRLRAQHADDVEYLYNVALIPVQLVTLRNISDGIYKGTTPNAQLSHLLDDIEAAFAFVGLLAALAVADALDIAGLGAGMAAAVNAADAAIAQKATPWLALGGPPVFSMDSRIRPRTAALFLALAGVAKGTDTPPPGTFDAMFTIKMTCTDTKAIANV